MYDPYGKVSVLEANGTTVRDVSLYGNPWTFTGRRMDQETGLMYYRNRMYDVGLGRFVSRDLIGYMGSMWNLYEYCSARPIRMVDALGLGSVAVNGMVYYEPAAVDLNIKLFGISLGYQSDWMRFAGLVWSSFLYSAGSGSVVDELDVNDRRPFMAKGGGIAKFSMSGDRVIKATAKAHSDKDVECPCVDWEVKITSRMGLEVGLIGDYEKIKNWSNLLEGEGEISEGGPGHMTGIVGGKKFDMYFNDYIPNPPDKLSQWLFSVSASHKSEYKYKTKNCSGKKIDEGTYKERIEKGSEALKIGLTVGEENVFFKIRPWMITKAEFKFKLYDDPQAYAE